LIREALKLKSVLPSNFQILIREAEQLSAQGNFSAAIIKYEELINICNESQNFTYIEQFQNKIDEIKLIIEKQTKQYRMPTSNKTFMPPEKIKFTQKVAVKSLPEAGPEVKKTTKSISTKSSLKPTEKSKSSIKAQMSGQTSKPRKLSLKPEDIKINLKSKIEKIQQIASIEPKKVIKKVQESDIVQKPKEIIQKIQPKEFIQKILSKEQPKPAPISIKTQEEKTEMIAEKKLALKNQLQQLIKNKGTDLNIDLCEFFIKEMTEASGEPLTIEDIQLAAEIFYKKEKAIW
ncbi:MAG: hypothetical protein ACFFDK_14475, partial [Promethearchaeota archaeon]